MRIVHTADWHVGKTLQGRSRLDEQEWVLDEIVELTRQTSLLFVHVPASIIAREQPEVETEDEAERWRKDAA